MDYSLKTNWFPLKAFHLLISALQKLINLHNMLYQHYSLCFLMSKHYEIKQIAQGQIRRRHLSWIWTQNPTFSRLGMGTQSLTTSSLLRAFDLQSHGSASHIHGGREWRFSIVVKTVSKMQSFPKILVGNITLLLLPFLFLPYVRWPCFPVRLGECLGHWFKWTLLNPQVFRWKPGVNWSPYR